MAIREALPFPRGKTFNDDGLITLTDTYADYLEGRIYEVPDTQHGYGDMVELRIVRNDCGGSITAANDLCQFTGATGDFGRSVAAYGATYPAGTGCTAGAVSKPLDDAYAAGKTIVDNDLFYVVESGRCNIRTESSSVSLSAGDAVAADGDGRINGAVAAAGEYVVGTIEGGSVDASTAATVIVAKGLVNTEA